MLDDDGNTLATFCLDKRKTVAFDELPKVLINAFVAAEDHSFFTHSGFSLRGMARSTVTNIMKWRVVQGASTITQQLVKLLFLSYERSLVRKIKELFLSLQLERSLTKQQIFELYVGSIYYGRGTYGVAAACERFWGKQVGEVSIAQAASLAAVAKSAQHYSPLNNPEKATVRRDIILGSMHKLGFITGQQLAQALACPVELSEHLAGNPVRLYVQEWLRTWAEKQFGREVLYSQGLTIQTTINTRMQEAAENAFREVIGGLRSKLGQELNGGMVSMEAGSGKMKAVIGGYDFAQSQYNRAFQAVRQTGSSFKPLVYACAVQHGIELTSTKVDAPFRLTFPGGEEWEPQNWHKGFEGEITLLKALITSNNIVTIKTMLSVGYEPIIELSRACGIHRELKKYPSLALGTAEATVEENVGAFNIFANHGQYVKPFLVEWVKDQWGNKVYENVIEEREVLDRKTTSKMVRTLAVRMEKARRYYDDSTWPDTETIGKTGSTNDSGTTWFVGSTPQITTAVYVGRDDNKGMGASVYGSQTSFPIWLKFTKATQGTRGQFYYEPSLREVSINWLTGLESDEEDNPHVVRMLVD